MDSPIQNSLWERKIPFRVDIAGVIELMGSSLYTAIETPIRELIQNAHDGVIRRRQKDLKYKGQIRVQPNIAENTISITDDGVGLSANQAEQFLGTLGIGLTGLIKGRLGERTSDRPTEADNGQLIGQFGVGLFSAFMIAESILVESRRFDANAEEAIAWFADGNDSISLAGIRRDAVGTTVTLRLKPECASIIDEATLEPTICRYADWLTVPIFVGDAEPRSNQCTAPWLEPTSESGDVERALEARFDETPLHVIPIRTEKPISIQGAVYVSPRRTPGFFDAATATLTVRRMVIREDIDGLFPSWASMLRGVMEIPSLTPTTSREDVVRNKAFGDAKTCIENCLFDHFEELSRSDPDQLKRIVTWHRYTFAGSAIEDERLRGLLANQYRFNTSKGGLTFSEILDISDADPLQETDADKVIWCNVDRRQESWITRLFANREFPCVHVTRSFEETLLALMVADSFAEGIETDIRTAMPSSQGFNQTVLNTGESEELDAAWQEHFADLPIVVRAAKLDGSAPAIAFLNQKQQLKQSFDDLRDNEAIPEGFQRLIDGHLGVDDPDAAAHEVVICSEHPIVKRALGSTPKSPAGTLLRISIIQALEVAGGVIDKSMRRIQSDDMTWLSEII